MFDTFSQELRLAGETERTRWMFGLFHANEDMGYGFPIQLGGAYEGYLSTLLINNIAGSLAPAGITVNTANGLAFLSEAAGRPFGSTYVGAAQRDAFEQNARSNALFGNITFSATDALDLTLGLRYTDERKQLESNYASPNGGAGCAAALANPARVGAALVARGVRPRSSAISCPPSSATCACPGPTICSMASPRNSAATRRSGPAASSWPTASMTA